MKEGASTAPRQRFWLLKLGLTAYFAYAGIRALRDADYRSLFAGVNFGVHELGHLVFAPFGEWMAIAGGSLAQVTLPLAAAALFWRQHDRFAVAVCIIWLAISLADIAVYAGDSRALELDLVSLSDDDGGGHDWNYLLDSMNLLRSDIAIARAMRVVSLALLALGALLATSSTLSGKKPAPSESAANTLPDV